MCRPRNSLGSWVAVGDICSILRHNYQEMCQTDLDRRPLKDTEVEADEMYQNAGEKGVPHLDPDDPPRRRANKRRGHGTMENDRPPVVGVVGRQSGEGRFEVVDNADQETLENIVTSATIKMRLFILMNGVDTITLPNWDATTPRCVTRRVRGSGPATMTGMESVKCTSTRWKGSGPGFGTSSAFFVV